MWFLSILHCIAFLALSQSRLLCGDNQVYMLARKQCQDACSKESFRIFHDGRELYASPLFEDYELRSLEVCLPSVEHEQYKIQIASIAGLSWSSGSWLEIQNEDGVCVFKTFMTSMFEEVYPLSFYRPIVKDEIWKLTFDTITGTWKAYDYADSAWSSVVLGSVSVEVTGTQYLRKKFRGLKEMAAYDLSLFYSQGIIAYINGAEILRDNLPSGPVQSQTPATGSYYSDGFHSFFRPGLEVAALTNILAVELHFLAGSHVTSCTFNCFLALLAPSVAEAPCWVLPQATVGSSLRGSLSERAFNFNKDDSFSMTPFAPLSLHFLLDTFVRAQVNGLRIWPSTEVTKTPRSFTFGGVLDSASEVAPMIRTTDAKYRSNRFASFFGFFNTGLFASFTLGVSQSNDVDLLLFEAQPMVCSLERPSAILFDAPMYVAVVGMDITPIVPTIYGFSQCLVIPALPRGLALNRDDCSIQGKPTMPLLTTEFTVTSVSADNVSGKFLLTVTEAVGTTLLITRSFMESPADESFAIIDAESGELLYGIPVNSGQQADSEVSKVLHVTCQRIRVELGCLNRAWALSSFLSIAVVISGQEKETLLHATYDEYLGLPAFYELNVRYPIPPNDEWFYWTESLPKDWFDNATELWKKGRREEFPEEARRLQLLKRVVTLPALEGVAGFTLGLRYQFGILVLVNGVEVFRDNVAGELNDTAVATGGYANVFYHLVSFPVVSVLPGEKAPHVYLHEGENVVAIALVAQANNQTLSSFDCTMSLLAAQSRVWDFTVTSASCFAGDSLFSFSYRKPFVASNCPQGDVLITFENGRREWISSVVVQIALNSLVGLPDGFEISGRNPSDASWTVLARVNGLTWFMGGQRTRIWLGNHNAYNQYRVKDFSGDAKITLSCFDLVADSLEVSAPVLEYPSVTVYSGVQMAEVYPSSSLYTGFTVTPTLPEGMQIDPYSGIIHGSSTLKGFSGYFTVVARTVLGQEGVAMFFLKVDACVGKHALLNVSVRSSGIADNEQLLLYERSKNDWKLLRSVFSIPAANPLVYYDFCLSPVFYKLMFQEMVVHRRQVFSGYSLQFSGTDFVFDASYMHETVATHTVEHTFSASRPFTMHLSKWRLCLDAAPTGLWTSYNYDDSQWKEVLPQQLPKLQMITLYLRRSFHLSRLSEMSVLNIRMCYVGGIVVYLNGVTVARFLLDSDFDSQTPGQDNVGGTCSVFHVVLATSGARDGANTIAVEMHRSETTSTPWFDAVGVFGVESCARVFDSVSVLEMGSQVMDAQRLFEVGSFEYASFSHSNGFVTWRVDNALGTHFNTYAITSREDYAEIAFELMGREETTDQWVEMALGINRTLASYLPSFQSVPVGAVGFREFRWELTRAVAMSHRLLSLAFYYCRTSGIVCPAMGDFPAVSDGQISPALCEEGFVGYRYKECHGGQFGETRTEKCFYRVPESLAYGSNAMEFVLNVPSQSVRPTFRYVVKRFTMDSGKVLPSGLQLNSSTGVIEGTPVEEVFEGKYKIYAENPSGAKSVVVRITVRNGYCESDGLLPYRRVGETAEYRCRDAGFAFGKLVKKCVLGATDGVWENGDGVCISYCALAFCLVLVVGVAAAAFYLVIRQRRRKEHKRRTTRHRLVSEGNRIIVY